MRLLLLLILIISSATSKEEVYICNSKGATKYHFTETCRGLKACKHEVIKKSIKDAKALGLTLCGWEE
jgi:hypothetical protein